MIEFRCAKINVAPRHAMHVAASSAGSGVLHSFDGSKGARAVILRLLAGTLLMLLAWLAATLLRAGVTRVFASTGWDEKLSAQAGLVGS